MLLSSGFCEAHEKGKSHPRFCPPLFSPLTGCNAALSIYHTSQQNAPPLKIVLDFLLSFYYLYLNSKILIHRGAKDTLLFLRIVRNSRNFFSTIVREGVKTYGRLWGFDPLHFVCLEDRFQIPPHPLYRVAIHPDVSDLYTAERDLC